MLNKRKERRHYLYLLRTMKIYYIAALRMKEILRTIINNHCNLCVMIKRCSFEMGVVFKKFCTLTWAIPLVLQTATAGATPAWNLNLDVINCSICS